MEGCCDVPAFAPCRAWCSVILEGADPEEAEYLVPEANIRLRPVGKYPHGCRGRGHLSVAAVLWHTWLVPLSRSVPLQLSIYPALLWFSEVYLLLTHPVSSQPVLCHRTHGATQQGSDSCLTASSPCTGRGRVRRCRFKRAVRAQEHKLLGFFSHSVPFYANENTKLHSAHYISIQASQRGLDENSKQLHSNL